MKLARATTQAVLGLAATCFALSASAVRPGDVSTTAEYVCYYRAIAAQHPDASLRNPDTLADKLCPQKGQLPREYEAARKFIEYSGEAYSPYFYVNARTRFIDSALVRAAGEGVRQVVVLGAGFDSRAYRFRGSQPDLRFYEVDLQPTLEEKKKRLAGIFGAVPDFVRYAPIDFDRQSLEDVLLPLGYDPKQRTFFVLEGVTMYVKAAGNAATMKFIGKRSASGSRVVYDYILRQAVEGRFGEMYGIGNITVGVALVGEPFVTGWTPREAAAFAKKHGGLRVVEDLGPKELTQRFLVGADGKPDGRMVDGHRLIEARVP